MKSITKLSKNDLHAMIKQAEAELAQRDHHEKALAEINKIIQSRGLSKKDLMDMIGQLTFGRGKKLARKASGSTGKAAPKYRNPTGSDTWTGRGRAPKWVNDICASYGIDINIFKNDPRFKI